MYIFLTKQTATPGVNKWHECVKNKDFLSNGTDSLWDLFPLPFDAINENPAIVQNPGYGSTK